MKKALLKVAVMLLCLAGVTPAMAQFNLKKAVGGAVKAAKAVTLTDEQMTAVSYTHLAVIRGTTTEFPHCL